MGQTGQDRDGPGTLLTMTDWVSDLIAGAAGIVAVAAFLDGRRRGTRQAATEQAVAKIEAERHAEELRPRLSIDESPWPQAEGTCTVRVRSQCDRGLHVSGVRVLERPALPSAVAGIVVPTTSSIVQHRPIYL